MPKTEGFDFIEAFEHAWIRYKSDFWKFIAFGVVLAVPSICFKFSITAGVLVTLVLGGFTAVLLANTVTQSARGLKNDTFSSPKMLLSEIIASSKVSPSSKKPSFIFNEYSVPSSV